MLNVKEIFEKEKNWEKRKMLESVYDSNKEYAKTSNSIDLLKNIMKSMQIMDRKFFAGKENEKICYDDEALPIGCGQTISQPTTVARMLLLSELKQGLDVLEIGSGSGWNASLIANIVKPGKVTSTERIKELHKNAQNNLNRFMKQAKTRLNVDFLYTDTFSEKNKVWKERYDRIITTAGANPLMIEKMKGMGSGLLKNNGILLYPTNEIGPYGALELWKKSKDGLKKIKREEGYSFVPLLEGETIK